MKYYPVFLRLEGRRCAVIGGGRVAERKVEGLLRAGGRVAVISPELTPRLAEWAAAGRIEHRPRRYHVGDLRGCFLAYGATDDDEVNREAARESEEEGVLLNAVDHPEECSFIAPAMVQRGDLIVAISTSGASPTLARHLRRRLEAEIGPEYADFLRILGHLRRSFAKVGMSGEERRRIFSALVDSPLAEHLRDGDREAADHLLAETVGPNYTLEKIGLSI